METNDHIGTLFDQVLWEIESGQVEQAVFRLAGILDGLEAAGEPLARIEAQYSGHRISDAFAHLGEKPWGRSSRCDRLEAAIARLGHARAIESRNRLARETFDNAIEQGQSVLLADDEAKAVVHALDQPVASRSAPFDLILAVGLSARLQPGGLATELSHLAKRLRPGGIIAITAFLPGGAGLFWHLLEGGDRLVCHDEAALQNAALSAGCDIRQFRDESDCLLWAVLRAPHQRSTREG